MAIAKILATETEARLTYLKRQLVKSVKSTRVPDKNTWVSLPLTREISVRAKELVREIKRLEDGE